MNNKNALLLPSGLYDLLPPNAAKESATVQRLLAGFESFGYQQVSPPLLEFENILLSGRGEALAPQTFRVSDPLSQEMMGIRADMTLQVARIAVSRLGETARPLRLGYAGPILQRKPDPLKSERQLTQAGIELIGSDSVEADAEVIMVAGELLTALGVENISVDINLPGLLSELCPEAMHDQTLRHHLREAVLRKETAVISGLPIANAEQVIMLMEAAGSIDHALEIMKAQNIPAAADLHMLASRLRSNCPSVALTLDPLEYRGFDYHHGIGFSIFAGGLRHELGRGGRYMVGAESAVGFTLSVTHLLTLLNSLPEKTRVLLPLDVDAATAQKLRGESYATIYALSDDMPNEALRLHCNYILQKGTMVQI